MTDQQPETVTVSKEEVDKMIADAVATATKSSSEQIENLKKEVIEKRLSSKELKNTLANAFGLGEDEKSDIEKLKEVIESNVKTVEQLKDELNRVNAEKEKNAKIEKVKEIANQLRFYNHADAISGIDLDGDIEEQVRQKANDFPHYIKKDNVGGNFNSYKSNVKLDDAVSEALKAKGLL